MSCARLNELIRLVALLPDETRQVFTLRKVYQLGHREIATRMGISESRVAACLVNAVLQIDSQLQKLERSERRCDCAYCRSH